MSLKSGEKFWWKYDSFERERDPFKFENILCFYEGTSGAVEFLSYDKETSCLLFSHDDCIVLAIEKKPELFHLSFDLSKFVFVDDKVTAWVCLLNSPTGQRDRVSVPQHNHGLSSIDDIQQKDGKLVLFERKSRLAVFYGEWRCASKTSWKVNAVVKLMPRPDIVQTVGVGFGHFSKMPIKQCQRRHTAGTCCLVATPHNLLVLDSSYCLLVRSGPSDYAYFTRPVKPMQKRAIYSVSN